MTAVALEVDEGVSTHLNRDTELVKKRTTLGSI